MGAKKAGMAILWAVVIICGLGTVSLLIWIFLEKKDSALPIIACISLFSIFFWTAYGIYKIYRPIRKNNWNNKNHASASQD